MCQPKKRCSTHVDSKVAGCRQAYFTQSVFGGSRMSIMIDLGGWLGGYSLPHPARLLLKIQLMVTVIDKIDGTGVYTLGIQSPCQMMIRVANHLLSIVFRFHYHSQKVIGSLGTYWLNLGPFTDTYQKLETCAVYFDLKVIGGLGPGGLGVYGYPFHKRIPGIQTTGNQTTNQP